MDDAHSQCENKRENENGQTSHHRLPGDHDKLGLIPALSMRFLIPAVSSKPRTVKRNKVTTSWSLGESRSARSSSSCHKNAKTSRLTETSRFYVTFLSRRCIWVCVSEGCPSADREVLIQAPLLGARQTRLRRIIGRVHMKDRVV